MRLSFEASIQVSIRVILIREQVLILKIIPSLQKEEKNLIVLMITKIMLMIIMMVVDNIMQLMKPVESQKVIS